MFSVESPGLATALEPAAHDGFRFATLVARHPGRVHIGGVDQIEAGIDEGVQQCKRGLLVRTPAKHVAAKRDGGHFEAGTAEFARCSHGQVSLENQWNSIRAG